MKQTKDDLKSVCELRAHLENFAARKAAERCQQGASAKQLELSLKRLEQSVRDGNAKAFHEADWQLHEAMISMAGVPSLPEAWQVVAGRMREFSRTSLLQYWPDLSSLLDEHRFLVQAIVHGDAYMAEDTATSHLDAVWYRIAESTEEATDTKDKSAPLERAVAYMAIHLARPIRLQTVAEEIAFVCPVHLSRLFLNRFGVSFQAYLIKLRMDKATDLLIHTRIPIGRIASRVGYADASRFGQHFKRQFGKTPFRYRQTETVPSNT